jgi:hypothetical protein
MIPKWIHQTWKTKATNPQVDRLRLSWIDMHPGFKYTLYDDTDIDRFIRAYFDDRVYTTYKRILNGSLKADFFRYCVLYIHGGVYVDIDLCCVRSLGDGIVCFDTDALVSASDYQEQDFQSPNQYYRRDVIFQGFLCAEPFHPFMQYMINYMCFAMSYDLFKRDIFRIGGPQAFADRFDELYFPKRRTPVSSSSNVVLREANNHLLQNKIKLVSHLHDCEVLGYDRKVFATCQHPVNRDHTPHYSRDFDEYVETGYYI